MAVCHIIERERGSEEPISMVTDRNWPPNISGFSHEAANLTDVA